MFDPGWTPTEVTGEVGEMTGVLQTRNHKSSQLKENEWFLCGVFCENGLLERGGNEVYVVKCFSQN